mmetsp:Transcript_75367/g.161460  ORF Transcript_75367/g.161460 Transcript_75367/m.161460 type:complete len:112 (-) Transcript_75367:1874-2209(-)
MCALSVPPQPRAASEATVRRRMAMSGMTMEVEEGLMQRRRQLAVKKPRLDLREHSGGRLNRRSQSSTLWIGALTYFMVARGVFLKAHSVKRMLLQTSCQVFPTMQRQDRSA